MLAFWAAVWGPVSLVLPRLSSRHRAGEERQIERRRERCRLHSEQDLVFSLSIWAFTFAGRLSVFAFYIHPWPCAVPETVNCNLSSPWRWRIFHSAVYSIKRHHSNPEWMQDECGCNAQKTQHIFEPKSPSLFLARSCHTWCFRWQIATVFAHQHQTVKNVNIR